MIQPKNHKRKMATKDTALLPTGIKVVAVPKSAARRKLLSGPDIATSGGARTVHRRAVVR